MHDLFDDGGDDGVSRDNGDHVLCDREWFEARAPDCLNIKERRDLVKPLVGHASQGWWGALWESRVLV